MANSTQLPIRPRPDLKVSRNANGADVVIAGLVEGSQGPTVQGLAPRAVKEAEETFGAPLVEVAIGPADLPNLVPPWCCHGFETASFWLAAELRDSMVSPCARLPVRALVPPLTYHTAAASK